MKLTGPKWVTTSGAVLVIALASALGLHYEGTSHVAYQDVAGVWTICAGHTHGVQPGDTATDAQCRAYLQQDMGSAYAAVNRCVDGPLTLGQAAAFTDVVYNLGPEPVCGNTGLRAAVRDGDVDEACMQLMRWIQANHAAQQGLINRRADEYAMCIGGVR